MAIANSIQAEIDAAIKKLQSVSNRATSESRRALGEGANVLVKAIQAAAPVSDEPHSRYKSGRIVATYYPGNLKRSFRKLVFGKSPAVFVGAKLDKGGSGGDFRGNRTDGYYAHMVEFGTANYSPRPFVRPAAASVGPTALRIATAALKRAVDAHIRSISI